MWLDEYYLHHLVLLYPKTPSPLNKYTTNQSSISPSFFLFLAFTLAVQLIPSRHLVPGYPSMVWWHSKKFCKLSVQFSHLVASNALRPHGLQHSRIPCLSPTPGAYSNSCPLGQWSHPTISSSVIPFSYPYNGSQHQGLFKWVRSSHQVATVFEVSASASVLPMNIQGWFPLGWTGSISLQSKGLSKVSLTLQFKAPILQHLIFFIIQFSHPYMTTGKTIALTR